MGAGDESSVRSTGVPQVEMGDGGSGGALNPAAGAAACRLSWDVESDMDGLMFWSLR